MLQLWYFIYLRIVGKLSVLLTHMRKAAGENPQLQSASDIIL
ncbi:hypothetical protein O7U_00169 [Bartonella quintana JK 68]|uniref:Uncharacterized protein n=1 Tax=Bartonella quintana JK 68 TaxID=1134503 RepID=A0ABR4SUX1_BARQI|nr:hypothetical protein Q651_01183 [Bartonella quintana BQ2-D70]KEC60030.1 hypothetical protein O93_00167 [Bartonella quintana JK 19]KEC60547.1 hypothetical protein O91_01138 [Bartonella quintana JK 31]KEC61790.1 hypothetical protein O7Y_01093 [Bartonella quintana JK 63]KEC64398.1 hypothetical protein O7W_00790 [Bartonella quintana JK 56]KEC66895.1 hypothetical protein O7U_00169 [Bartonella quintana JK 68]KEC67763.1 hypothetical protein O7S_00663 [Bartonella quintana JK 67]KEC68134.1 hypothe